MRKPIQLSLTMGALLGALVSTTTLSGCQAAGSDSEAAEQTAAPMQQGPEKQETERQETERQEAEQQQGQSADTQSDDPKLPIDDQPEPTLPDTDNIEQEHRQLRDILLGYSRNNQADSADQCATFPMGHKACGGPEQYQVYSQKGMSDSDIKTLQQQVERYNQLDAALKVTSGVVSNCEVTPEPEIRFENGRCLARPQF